MPPDCGQPCVHRRPAYVPLPPDRGQACVHRPLLHPSRHNGRMTMTVAARRRLIAVSRGDRKADLYVRGGALLNVHTGEIYPANVAIAGERIAYVGLREDMVRPRTR